MSGGPWEKYKDKATPKGPWEKYAQPSEDSSIGDDIWNDAKANGTALAAPILHPADTARGVFDAYVMGPASKLMRKTGLTDALASSDDPEIDRLNKDIEAQKAKSRERTLDAVTDAIGDDLSHPVHTITHKPFTALNDISTVALPFAGMPGRVGQVAGLVSRANPASLALEGGARVLRPLSGYMRTGEQIDPRAIADRQAASQEFEVPLTQGQVSGDASMLSKEDNLRYARSGQAQKVMQAFDEGQDQAITNATDRLRQGLTRSNAAMSTDDVGDTLGSSYANARQAARGRVSAMYDRAFDPAELAQRGISTDVPIETIMGLRNAVDDSFNNAQRPMFPPTPELTPAAYRAVQKINEFSDSNGAIPSAYNKLTVPPQGGNPLVTGMSWQGLDTLRKQLNTLRTGLTNPADIAAMNRVMDAFDQHVGQSNPLLNDARAAHSARMEQFEPQRDNAAGVNSFLREIANQNNPGQLIYNKLFNGSAIKNGTAGPLIDQLTSIIGHDAGAMSAFKEGMIQRLTTNLKTGDHFSPKITANNIRDALGGQSRGAYQQVFTPQELDQLGRYGDLLDNVGVTRAAQNPSKTSYNVLQQIKQQPLLGAMAGELLGLTHGVPGLGGAIFGYGAQKAGELSGNVLAHRAAVRATTAPYVPPTPTSNGIAGIANLMQSGAPMPRVLSPGILSILQQQNQNGQ